MSESTASDDAPPTHVQTPVEQYRAAAAACIYELQCVIAKRKGAIDGLLQMQKKGFSLQAMLSEAMGGSTEFQVGGTDAPFPNDPTMYLTGIEREMNIVNKLCTDAGIVAITANIKQLTDDIKDLLAFEACFSPPGFVVNSCGTTVHADGVWLAIDQVNDYVLTERENDNWMSRAGY
jgi:hypothetical protein